MLNLYPSLPGDKQMVRGLRGNIRIKCDTGREIEIEVEIEIEMEMEIDIPTLTLNLRGILFLIATPRSPLTNK